MPEYRPGDWETFPHNIPAKEVDPFKSGFRDYSSMPEEFWGCVNCGDSVKQILDRTGSTRGTCFRLRKPWWQRLANRFSTDKHKNSLDPH